MLLETQIQGNIIVISLIVFIFVSPLLNIIYLPKLIHIARSRWKVRIVMLVIYLIWLVLLYWSVFIYI
jgi:hypothetical protein